MLVVDHMGVTMYVTELIEQSTQSTVIHFSFVYSSLSTEFYRSEDAVLL